MVDVDPIAIEGTGIRAVFSRSGNRWSHRLEIQSKNTWEIVLESVEGTDDDAWPPSPAIQELHLQGNGMGHSVALGVGMSGKTHWSLCCMPYQRLSNGASEASGVRFEIACRAKETFRRIGSNYHVVPPMKLLLGQSEIQARSGEIGFDLLVQGVDTVAEMNQRIRLDLFAPDNLHQRSLPHTWQWSYQIQSNGN